MADEKTKERVQFDLPPEFVRKIDETVSKTGMSTRAEMFRHALNLYIELMNGEKREVTLRIRDFGIIIIVEKTQS
jgi:metal-responsive CopG/Arc/MetJ family transcriptional regulator